MNAVRAAGGNIVGAASICSRGNCDATALGVEQFRYLCEILIPAWPAKDCQLCQQNATVKTTLTVWNS
jgi:orotate phosphoribosyltransferase